MVQGTGLDALADALAQAGKGLIMVMGKGGVDKTTIAAALAIGLVQHGKSVHPSTTDPAAHLAVTLDGAVDGLRVDRVDPVVETQRYVDRIMSTKGTGLTGEHQQMERISQALAKRIYVVPWKVRPPIGRAELSTMVEKASVDPY